MSVFRSIRAALAIATVASLLTLSGCATTSSSLKGSSTGARSAHLAKRDLDYMAAVDAAARTKGVRVVWVNPPPELGKRYTR